MRRMTQKQMDEYSFNQLKEYRGLPNIHVGMDVEIYDGTRGKIVKAQDGYVLVKLESGQKVPCHPQWKIKYFFGDGTIAYEFGE